MNNEYDYDEMLQEAIDEWLRDNAPDDIPYVSKDMVECPIVGEKDPCWRDKKELPKYWLHAKIAKEQQVGITDDHFSKQDHAHNYLIKNGLV